ncbi:unnamed protein product [Sphagnum troendelagicum]|uniref:Amino acid transporter transmembrane domain-containing protein n=1 Tax=Sphagnum troendelagicum TaxID=128251 RepID=A0ABP0UE82_9BRYO
MCSPRERRKRDVVVVAVVAAASVVLLSRLWRKKKQHYAGRKSDLAQKMLAKIETDSTQLALVDFGRTHLKLLCCKQRTSSSSSSLSAAAALIMAYIPGPQNFSFHEENKDSEDIETPKTIKTQQPKEQCNNIGVDHAAGASSIFKDVSVPKRRNVEEWLPVTSSRNAKWWYSAFHNVTAMVGAGVLSLPSAMAYLTWGPGVAVLLSSWVITLFTLWQLVQMHEMKEVPGKRFDRYHELGQHAFGKKLGIWLVVPQQLIVEIGVDIVYMVTGGSSLMGAYELLCTGGPSSCRPIRKTAWIAIFGSVHFFLAQCPNFNAISLVSFCAAIMSLSYSAIAWVAPLASGQVADVSYALPDTSRAGLVFGILNALGQIAFAYAGHNVVLEIQATLPSTPEKPSKGPMWRGCLVAYVVVAACYFPVAMVGYWAMGNGVGDNVLLSLGKPVWLIAAARLMVVVHVIGSYQVYAMPVFDMMETFLVKKLEWNPTRFLRLWVRSLYVAFTIFMAMTIPFFGDLLGFLGGFAFAPTTFFLPCCMWLTIYKPKAFSISWILNWVCILLGVLLAVTSSVGGLRQIIISYSTYKLYE